MEKNYIKVKIAKRKHIALIAHDGKKKELISWVKRNQEVISSHILCGTGTTSSLINEHTGLEVERFKSGPLGGDQQIGSRIAEGKIDMVIFLWDPLESQPHDPDVKALLRIAAVYDIPIANNLATADFIIQSALMNDEYEHEIEDYDRKIKNRIEEYVE